MPRFFAPLVLIAAVLAASMAPSDTLAAGVPAGFEEQILARISRATVLEFTPDGRMLVGQQTGQVRVIKNGILLPTAALDLGRSAGGAGVSCATFERGLLGMAADPQFAANGYVYLFYTYCAANNTPIANRVARFTMVGDRLDYASQLVLVDNIAASGPYHQGGSLRFGADGYLYIATGDNYTQGAVSQNFSSLNGKILRIDRATGRGVPGNPFYGSPNAGRCGAAGAVAGPVCEEIFAWGLRNPFRIAMRPGSSEFFINDVGQRTWEEISRGGVGVNHGWPQYEGPCLSNSACLDPQREAPADVVYYYRHGASTGLFAGGCAAITGGVFVPSGVWPAQYDNSYLFADYVCGRVFRLDTRTGAASLFAGAFGEESVADLIFGPDGAGRQALYYVSYSGTIGLVRYTGSVNRAPLAVATASPTTGRTPLTVSFDGRQSSDPDGQALSYSWFFGDGTSASGPTVSHTYNVTGSFEVTLTVSDGSRSTVSAPINITPGNQEPTATITSPAPPPYAVGQTFTIEGRGDDPEEGVIPAERLIWNVWLHHDEHVHPVLTDVAGRAITVTTLRPEDLAAVDTNYLEVQLAARDSKGLESPLARLDLRPRIVTMTLATDPPGFDLVVNGERRTTPSTLRSWPGYTLHLGAPAQMSASSERFMLTGWLTPTQRGELQLITPDGDATLTAQFQPSLYDRFICTALK